MYFLLLLPLLLFPASSTLLDISHPLNDKSTNWPTANVRRYNHTTLSEYDGEEGYYISKELEFTEHVGTHLDSPLHFGKSAWDTASIPLKKLIVPVVKIDVRGACAKNRDYSLSVADLHTWTEKHGPVPDNAVILMETGWTDKYGDWEQYYGSSRDTLAADFNYTLWWSEISFPGFSPELAAELVANYNIAGVGLDTPSIDPGTSRTFSVHTTLMTNNIYGLENLCCLRDVPEQGATLMVFPAKVEGGSGFPVRAIVDTDSRYAFNMNSGIRKTCEMMLIVLLVVIY